MNTPYFYGMHSWPNIPRVLSTYEDTDDVKDPAVKTLQTYRLPRLEMFKIITKVFIIYFGKLNLLF